VKYNEQRTEHSRRLNRLLIVNDTIINYDIIRNIFT
jgi:hypothetical protein